MKSTKNIDKTCPHCGRDVAANADLIFLGEDTQGAWALIRYRCTSSGCGKFHFELQLHAYYYPNVDAWGVLLKSFMVYPKGSLRRPCPTQVPQYLTEDYKEACLVLPDSAKASAALSRRCLQNLLREHCKVEHANLYDEIQELLDRKELPTYLATDVDAIRNIGNFAAHPTKSKSTGEIVEVEPKEAEWNLTVLEGLFDFYFVQPEIQRQRKAALNEKLDDAGKPPAK